MKRNIRTFAVGLLLVFLLQVSCFAVSQLDHVTDAYGLMTDSQITQLERKANSIEQQYGIGIYLVIVDNWRNYVNASSVKAAADAIYDEYTLGCGTDREGVLLLLSMSGRDYVIIDVGPLSGMIFTDSMLDRVEDSFLDNFGRNDWAGGASDYLETCANVISERQESASQRLDRLQSGNILYSGGRSPGINLLLLLGVPCILAGIVLLVFASQMRNAKEKTTAGDYVNRNSVHFTVREDRFIRRTETRTKIESSKGSGGGGGGYHGHSGKF